MLAVIANGARLRRFRRCPRESPARRRETRTAMPDLRGASSPSRLRVPSGKSATIPPFRNRRRVSLRADALIPSRWIGNPPSERSRNPITGMKRVDRARKLSGRCKGIPSRKGSWKLEMVGDQSAPPVAGMLCRPVAQPGRQSREQGREHTLGEPVPEPGER